MFGRDNLRENGGDDEIRRVDNIIYEYMWSGAYLVCRWDIRRGLELIIIGSNACELENEL